MKKIFICFIISFSFSNDTNNTIINKNQAQIDYGRVLFQKCASCHGNNAQKKALNKSRIIKGWEIQKVYNALKGYKDGTYGRKMKKIMKMPVITLSDGDLKALSYFINSLNPKDAIENTN